jgi:5-methylcytosine-specific restriction protein A
MGQLEDLTPVEKRRVYDLVKDAGLDVSDWANYSRGTKWAAANPKYCYEWAFLEPGRLVILNLWRGQLREHRGSVSWSGNLREWIKRHSVRGAKAVWRRRAEVFQDAVAEAARRGLPVRVIVNDGTMRSAADASARPSQVQRRLLDPLPWAVSSYDSRSGQCLLIRGLLARGSVDQFDLPQQGGEPAERISVQSTVFMRDSALRAAALQRANGRCEFCGRPGFTMSDGRVFLETHHIVPLSAGGPDSADNIAAVCPNHHREAHHGSQAESIRNVLLQQLRRARGTRQSGA